MKKEVWTPNKEGKTPHIPVLINEIVRLIKVIEGMGGSVKFRFIPRHNNTAGWKAFEEAYINNRETGWHAMDKAQRTAFIYSAKQGNNEVDILAKNTEHKDTLTAFINKIKTGRERAIKSGYEITDREQGEGKIDKKDCE
jgi:hypothetical protein